MIKIEKNARVAKRDRRCPRCGKPPSEPHYERCPMAQLELIPHCEECGKPQGEHFARCPNAWAHLAA